MVPHSFPNRVEVQSCPSGQAEKSDPRALSWDSSWCWPLSLAVLSPEFVICELAQPLVNRYRTYSRSRTYSSSPLPGRGDGEAAGWVLGRRVGRSVGRGRKREAGKVKHRMEGKAEGSRKKLLPLPLEVLIRSWVLPLSVLMSFRSMRT